MRHAVGKRHQTRQNGRTQVGEVHQAENISKWKPSRACNNTGQQGQKGHADWLLEPVLSRVLAQNMKSIKASIIDSVALFSPKTQSEVTGCLANQISILEEKRKKKKAPWACCCSIYDFIFLLLFPLTFLPRLFTFFTLRIRNFLSDLFLIRSDCIDKTDVKQCCFIITKD